MCLEVFESSATEGAFSHCHCLYKHASTLTKACLSIGSAYCGLLIIEIMQNLTSSVLRTFDFFISSTIFFCITSSFGIFLITIKNQRQNQYFELLKSFS